MSGEGQREAMRDQETSCLSRPSCLSRQETPYVSYDNRGKSGESHKAELDATIRLGGLI